MSYELEFKKSALKEWKKLGATLQTQFKKKQKINKNTNQKILMIRKKLDQQW